MEYVFEISIKEKEMNTFLFFLGDIIVGGQVIAEASVDMMQVLVCLYYFKYSMPGMEHHTMYKHNILLSAELEAAQTYTMKLDLPSNL